MNIAYILHSTVQTEGSAKSFLVMLKGLMSMGINPIIIAPNDKDLANTLKEMGIPVYATTYRMCAYPQKKTLSHKLLFLPRLLGRIIVNHRATKDTINILQKHAIDIVHTNVGLINIGFRAAQKLGIPHVFHLREYGKLDFGLEYFPNIQYFYKLLDDVPHSYSICITRDIQHYHHQDGKTSSRVIYNGICPQMETMPYASKNSQDYFLYAGRIESAKGVDSLLEAYSLYIRQTPQPIPLRIAGLPLDEVYMKRLQQLINNHALHEYVTFLGDRRDITDLMRDARAIIIPSLHEGFGRCMPEAMMQGCLAIGRNTSGTKEQFDNGLELTGEEIGLRYDTNEELAKLLKEVTLNPISHYQPYRERAFRTVNSLYTQEQNTQRIYSFYKDILKET